MCQHFYNGSLTMSNVQVTNFFRVDEILKNMSYLVRLSQNIWSTSEQNSRLGISGKRGRRQSFNLVKTVCISKQFKSPWAPWSYFLFFFTKSVILGVFTWLLWSFVHGCHGSWHRHSFETAQHTAFKYLSYEPYIKSLPWEEPEIWAFLYLVAGDFCIWLPGKLSWIFHFFQICNAWDQVYTFSRSSCWDTVWGNG